MNLNKLSEIAHIVMGQSPEGNTCNSIGLGIPLLNGPAEFTSINPLPVQYTTDPKKYSKEGGILFCVRGSTTGRMNWSDKPYAIGRGLASISHKMGVHYNHYLRYVIQTNLDSLLRLTGGSTFPNLTNDVLSDFLISTPSLDVQKKISFFLRLIDSKISLNNRINAELEAMAKTIYDYWFVQFDFPNERGKPYKSSGGKMVWNEELKREIPEGWEVNNITAFGKLLGGGTPKTGVSEYWNGNIPFFTPSDSSTSYFTLVTEKSISNEGLESCSSDLFPKGTVFITARGTVGKLNIASRDMAMNQSCYAIEPNKSVNYPYLHQNCIFLVQQLKAKANGSIFDAIVSNDIKLAKMPVPPLSIVTHYGNIVGQTYERILNVLLENQQLVTLRDWLLPMLMNGQVTVKD
jgi:type I restriction enzyme S subunit